MRILAECMPHLGELAFDVDDVVVLAEMHKLLCLGLPLFRCAMWCFAGGASARLMV